MNVAFYSRYYKVTDKDAMGVNNRRRGFNDGFLWTAHTTQDKVVALSVEDDYCTAAQPDCEVDSQGNKRRVQRWTYAIPLEIVYLTPLTKWNPYNIVYHGDNSNVPTMNQRDGVPDNLGCVNRAAKALNGTNRKLFYRTPKEFFAENDENRDPADTSAVGGVCVLDDQGVPQRVEATGHWIVFPEIGGGVGQVRQRYPIPPIHAAGSTTWKELEALKDIIFAAYDYEGDQAGIFGDLRDSQFGFSMSLQGGGHEHDFFVSASRVQQWLASDDTAELAFTTETRNSHSHRIKITRSRPDADSPYTYTLEKCKFSGQPSFTDAPCVDGHNVVVRV